MKSGLADKQASLLPRADHDDATKNNESAFAVLYKFSGSRVLFWPIGFELAHTSE
jgi:hypothetical protein